MPTSRARLIEERRSPDNIVTIAMQNGRLNTLTRPLRLALIDALDRAESDRSVRAVVLIGADGVFSAGADLKEFDSGEGLAEPSLHRTIADFLDEMSTPVVAAIDGLALGGGLELALSCHWRIATPSARLGLPEVGFGFLPGAGGTQRLPRSIGAERGVQLMLTGESVLAVEVAGTRLISTLIEGDDVQAAAERFAAGIADELTPRLRDVSLRDDDAEALLAYLARGVRGDAPREAVIAAVRAGVDDVDAGFAAEQRLFRMLAESGDAGARRHLFLAERAARRRPTTGGDVPRAAVVGIIGGGTMGRGIALAHALAGFEVVVIEADEARSEMTRAAIVVDAARATRRGNTGGRTTEEVTALITCTARLDAVANADLVIEAVPEIMELKLSVFRQLDAIATPTAILATNTSSLDVDLIAATVSRPQNVVGLHFFSPAHVMRLVEIVEGARSSPRTMAFVLAHAELLRKVPVVAGVGPGFIGNRILEASHREVGLMLLEGVEPARIDAALEAWGMRMGPLRVLDLVGNDVPMHARVATGTAAALEWKPAAALVERGWLGVKSGRGWYRHVDGVAQSDPEVIDVIRGIAAEAGVVARDVSDREIVERVILPMVNEGAQVLADKVARRAGDIDVVFTRGYGFPPEKGGPMYFADQLGLSNAVRIMRRYESRAGGERWVPHQIVVEAAQQSVPLARWGASA